MFFVEKKREVSPIFKKNGLNFNETLTNDVVSFEQPDPGVKLHLSRKSILQTVQVVFLSLLFLIIVQIIFCGPLKSLGSFLIIFSEKRAGARGAWPVLHISVLGMNRLNTTESAIFFYLVYSFLPKYLTI